MRHQQNSVAMDKGLSNVESYALPSLISIFSNNVFRACFLGSWLVGSPIGSLLPLIIKYMYVCTYLRLTNKHYQASCLIKKT